MIQIHAKLAQKYASALYNSHSAQFDATQFDCMRRAIEYCDTHRHISFFLAMSALNVAVKQRAITNICQKFGLADCIVTVCELLIAHGRIFLFKDVLSALCQEYLKRSGMLEFEFVSSATLSDSDSKIMQQFLAYKTGKTIIYRCRVDTSLIAGVRLINTQWLWQYSLGDQLRRITTALAE